MNKTLAHLISLILSILVVLLLAGVLIIGIQFNRPPGETAKTYCVENGSAETGAVNLVTAIYLEYRAFDTLGETVVLILSIGGVIFFLEQRHA
jgi:multicomponent Na+:H+ antiporter subunit B